MYKVPKKASWLIDLPNDLLSNENFQKIYYFFVVNSIVKDVSARGKDLSTDYGWKNPWSKPVYLNKQIKAMMSQEDILFSAQVFEQSKGNKKKAETMEEALEKADLKTFPQYENEKICIYNSKKNQILSTFAHIRNSFAHCRFNVVDHNNIRVYCFEDVEPNGKDTDVKVTARMVIFEKTLLKWISLISEGERNYTELD